MRNIHGDDSRENVKLPVIRKLLFGIVLAIIVLGVGLLAIGYQPLVYLMPTPAVFEAGEVNPFNLGSQDQKNTELKILYATNRGSTGGGKDPIYTIFPGKYLRMGTASLRVGAEELPWEQLLKLSTSKQEGRRPVIRLVETEELGTYPLIKRWYAHAGDTQNFTQMVNQALAHSTDKDITIYVHGANTAIFRACAQAAQYHHFTGQNSVVLAYLWPSAENLFAYGTDTRHALHSAPAFASLLELLAEHTDAEHINIIAYSAGAQIVSPALELLGRELEKVDRQGLGIGQVYYAAADIGLNTFVQQLQSYIDIPRRTTLAINMKDSVLALSARRDKESRAGSPDRNDLSVDQYKWVSDASRNAGLDLISIDAETVSGMKKRSHDFWYSHPWVSSDVLTQFLLHKTPDRRGLEEARHVDDLRYWAFPEDYPERITNIVVTAVSTQKE